MQLRAADGERGGAGLDHSRMADAAQGAGTVHASRRRGERGVACGGAKVALRAAGEGGGENKGDRDRGLHDDGSVKDRSSS